MRLQRALEVDYLKAFDLFLLAETQETRDGADTQMARIAERMLGRELPKRPQVPAPLFEAIYE